MRPETRQSMEMLFAMKWNLPKREKLQSDGQGDEDYVQ